MTTLELQAKTLQSAIGAEDDQYNAILEGLKSYAVTVLNLAQYLREKNVDMDTARGIMEGHGISYDGKSKKFK